MRRNVIVLTVLVVGQLALLYGLRGLPGTVDWSSEVRMGVATGAYLLLGAVAFLMFSGKRERFLWVAVTGALPLLVGEGISSLSPTAYPGLGFVVVPVVVVVMLIGAISTSAIKSKLGSGFPR
jgi:hypothetical protein